MERILTSSLALLLLAASVPSQAAKPAERLARIHAVAQQEGDLAAAERAYRELLADPKASAAHDDAAFGLGQLLWQLDRRDEAKPLLDLAAGASEALASKVQALRASTGELAQALQDQRAQAHALVARYDELAEAAKRDGAPNGSITQAKLQHVGQELDRLGAPAALAIADWFRQSPLPQNNRLGAATEAYAGERALLRKLWAIGTQPAVDYLSEAAQSGRIEWQRFVVAACGEGVATDLEPVLQQFARTVDPTREVWRSVVDALVRQKAVPAACLQDNHPAVIAAGLTAVRVLQAYVPEMNVQPHANVILSAAQSPDITLHAPAWDVLHGSLEAPNNARLQLFLSALRRNPERVRTGRIRHQPYKLSDQTLAQLADAAEQLGRYAPDGSATPAQTVLASLFHTAGLEWSRAALPDVLRILTLHYGDGLEATKTIARAYTSGSVEQRRQILTLIPGFRSTNLLISKIQVCGADPELFETLREVVATVGNRKNTDGNPEDCIPSLFYVAARTGHPEAAAWLAEQIEIWPKQRRTIAWGLVLLSRAGDASAAPGLRRLLRDTSPANADATKTAMVELVRLGDEQSIPLMPRALATTLRASNQAKKFMLSNTLQGEVDGIGPRYEAFLSSWDGSTVSYTSASSDPPDDIRLFALRFDGRQRPWHGYSDTQLTAVWRALLTGSHANAVWNQMQPSTSVTHSAVQVVLPAAAATVFAEVLPKRKLPASDCYQLAQNLASGLQRLDEGDYADSESLQRGVRALIELDETEIAATCYGALPRAVAEQLASVALQRLRAESELAWVQPIIEQGLPLTLADWRMLLANTSATNNVLYVMPANVPAELRTDIRMLLSDDEATVRQSAVDAMVRAFGAAAASDLLPLLQDPVQSVAEAAREHLKALRELREQRQFWARAKDGVDLSPPATSQKLVKQAMPDNDAAQRLLAIRSLGAVGATEALPYLIEWSQGNDEQIRSAAARAVQAILKKSEADKPETQKSAAGK
ncbi:MAG: HEAT repeat domain-containing protein [Planctomycetota bacterium]